MGRSGMKQEREQREFADSLELSTETAEDVEAATHLLASASMGPEFVFEVVEGSRGSQNDESSTKPLAADRTPRRPPVTVRTHAAEDHLAHIQMLRGRGDAEGAH